MKILSINNFVTKLLSKFVSDLIRVHLKGTKKFGVKLLIYNIFIERLGFSQKGLSKGAI